LLVLLLICRLASDPLLSGVTHVVVDEVHERSLQGDVLMALLQRIAAARNAAADAAGVKLGQTNSHITGDQVPQRLKVVLMSATLDANIYSAYYWGCPVLSCPGRTFPVTVRYLEDCYAETR
jgi:ATP-dependent RNA helicase DHX29